MSAHTFADNLRVPLGLLACLLTTFALGSVHAFSVYLQPFELKFGATRSEVGLVYSLALVALTAAVLFGHPFYARIRPSILAASAIVCGSMGLAIAAWSETLLGVYLGYGLAFGFANGIGYGFVLQLCAHILPRRAGLAMGLVTASYAAGSVGFAMLNRVWLRVDLESAIVNSAYALLAAALLVWLLFEGSRARFAAPESAASQAADEAGGQLNGVSGTVIAKYWLSYGCAVLAGLMAIGHATGLMQAAGVNLEDLALAVAAIGIGNALGGVFAALGFEHFGGQALLTALPTLSGLVLFTLAFSSQAVWTSGALALIGFSYGAIIAAYPPAIFYRCGSAGASRVYGRVFTAWGLSGLCASWFAAWIYDGQGNYNVALLFAAALSLVSAGIAWFTQGPDNSVDAVTGQ